MPFSGQKRTTGTEYKKAPNRSQMCRATGTRAVRHRTHLRPRKAHTFPPAHSPCTHARKNQTKKNEKRAKVTHRVGQQIARRCVERLTPVLYTTGRTDGHENPTHFHPHMAGARTHKKPQQKRTKNGQKSRTALGSKSLADVLSD